jgi:hypothetical protein
MRGFIGKSAYGVFPEPPCDQGMLDDPEELAAPQRLAPMFVPEAERAAFIASRHKERSHQRLQTNRTHMIEKT